MNENWNIITFFSELITSEKSIFCIKKVIPCDSLVIQTIEIEGTNNNSNEQSYIYGIGESVHEINCWRNPFHTHELAIFSISDNRLLIAQNKICNKKISIEAIKSQVIDVLGSNISLNKVEWLGEVHFSDFCFLENMYDDQ